MIRELDQSKITLRLVEHTDKEGKGENDNSIAHLSGPVLSTLQESLVSKPISVDTASRESKVLGQSTRIVLFWAIQPNRSQYTPHAVILRNAQGAEIAKVNVLLKYLPIDMKLDPSERADNSGKLKVDVMDAADLPAADRNGFSDPYCKFILNGKEVFKSDKQRKTLHPAWNESFETMIRSRTASKFVCEVWDWDFGDKSDFLGKADINLELLEPFTQKEVTLGLDGKSGAVRLRMLFTPEYVTRQRQGSSTFHGTFATPGKVVGAPVKGIGKGAVLVGGAVGGGVVKAGTLLGGAFKRHKSGMQNESAATDASSVADQSIVDGGDSTPGAVDGYGSRAVTPSTSLDVNHTGGALSATPTGASGSPAPLTPHSRTKSWGATSQSTYGASPGGDTSNLGTASIALLSASGFPPAAHLRLILSTQTPKGQKELLKTKALKPSGPSSTAEFDSENVKVRSAADAPFRVKAEDHKTFGSDQDLGEGQFFLADQGGGGEQVVRVGSGSVRVRSAFVAGEPSADDKLAARAGTLKRFSRNSRERSATPS